MIFLVATKTPFVSINFNQLLVLLALAFFGIFSYNVFFFSGLHHIEASRASLIVAITPAIMALASFLILKERLSFMRILGIAFCLAGAGVVITSGKSNIFDNSGAQTLWGDLLMLGCVVSWVIYSVFSKKLAHAIGPLHTVTYSILLGASMLIGATIAMGHLKISSLASLTPSSITVLLYLGILGSALAYIWYYDAIQKIGATRSGAFIALNPLTAVLLGSLILGESLTLPACMGGALVIAGICFCNRNPDTQRRQRLNPQPSLEVAHEPRS